MSLDLTEAIRVLENRKKEVELEYDNDIKELKEEIEKLETFKQEDLNSISYTLVELRKQNTVCEYCRGNREVRETDAAGDSDWETCKKCRGTGKSK